MLAYKFYYNCLPFTGTSNVEILQQVAEADIDLDKVDPTVEELIVLCLKRNPSERASAKMLKMCSLFKGVNFKQIFQMEPPLTKQELTKGSGAYLLEQPVDKRMFFGNFKPRLLTMSKSEHGLMMAYRYPQSKVAKR
jgi:hypothetical protein